jgi:hypothetical protein
MDLTLAQILRAQSLTSVNPNTVNGKHVDIAITVRGSDFYYAICCQQDRTAFSSTLLQPST